MGDSGADLMDEGASPPSSPPPSSSGGHHHSCRHHKQNGSSKGHGGGASRLMTILRNRRMRLMRQDHERAAGRNMSLSQSDSGTDSMASMRSSRSGSCKCHCESRKSKRLFRTNSSQSQQSAATIQTFLSSASQSQDYLRKKGANRERSDSRDSKYSRYEDLGDDNVIDGLQVIAEREMNSFQKHIPGLKRHDAKTSTIRQHYYPEGGWGWLICACVFVVHMLTTGLQFSFGVLYTDLLEHVGEDQDRTMSASWVGATSLAVSRLAAPLVVALCRRKSTRLTAVIGGLVMSLALLFASFALHLHQIFVSYGIVLGIGVGMTRETANLMLGQYFKRRREFVEIIAQSGCGIGITLFSVFFKESIRSVGWRLGLQAVTGVTFTAFFLGIFYRSASLYHPQRRAILHLKNQKRKQVKDKAKVQEEKPPYFDPSCLKYRSVQILIATAAASSMGLYTPLFYLILSAEKEGLEDSSLILLQTFLGFAYALGCIGFGLIVVKQSSQCMISRQYLCQGSMFLLGVTVLALTAVKGYYGYVLFMWLYGILLGGSHYAFQMLTLEKVRARHFSRAWGFIQGATALPILIGVPITGYINQSNPKTGYFFASFFIIVGASCLFLLNFYKKKLNANHDTSVSFTTVDAHVPHEHFSLPVENGGGKSASTAVAAAAAAAATTVPVISVPPVCTCGVEQCVPLISHQQVFNKLQANNKLGKSISFATSVDVMEPQKCLKPELLTCISEEGGVNHYYDYVGDCVNSCSKFDNMFAFNECDPDLEIDYENEEEDQETVIHRPIAEVRVPSVRRQLGNLRQASGVSFSEPDGLARLGQSDYYPGATHLQHPMDYNIPPIPHPPMVRHMSNKSPRRSITVIENMTTSV